MSFVQLYRRRRGPGNYTVDIACALTALLVLNFTSLLFFGAALIWRGKYEGPTIDQLIDQSIHHGLLGLIPLGVFFAELALVRFVQDRAKRGGFLATRLRGVDSTIAVRYTGISVVALLASIAAVWL